MVSVRIVTRSGGKTTPKDKEILTIVKRDYQKALKQMKINREIPLLILDEWTWKHLKLKPISIALFGYNDKTHYEQIFLRRDAFGNEIGNEVTLIGLLKHELIHAKLKEKERHERENKHGKEFQTLESKHRAGYHSIKN